MFMLSTLIIMISLYIILISVILIIRKENSAFGHAWSREDTRLERGGNACFNG